MGTNHVIARCKRIRDQLEQDQPAVALSLTIDLIDDLDHANTRKHYQTSLPLAKTVDNTAPPSGKPTCVLHGF